MLDLRPAVTTNGQAAAAQGQDPILYWNEVALEANRVSQTNGFGEQNGPTLASRALGIVHLAIYDAYIGIVGGFAPYLPDLPTPAPGASPEAAVAAAAHATLSALFPSQRASFDEAHVQAPKGASGRIEGRAFGLAVAEAILQDRGGDPDADDAGYGSSPAHGAHRVDPDNPGQGFHAPFYGAQSKMFAVTDRHYLLPPPQPGDPDYTAALEQVLGLGIASELAGTLQPGAFRSVNQELIGLFWAYDGASGIGTPPRLYNQIVRQVAINAVHPMTGAPNTPAQNARLFALVNVAMADAGILAWDQKYIHDLWRPVVGVREHDVSMGPSGIGDNVIDDNTQISWLPLGAPSSNAPGAKNVTPGFPAYPSGHATFGAAAFQITRRFYEIASEAPDDLFDGLSFVSDELDGMTTDNKGTIRPRHVRTFPGGLRQMIEENSRSRIYLGVHWSFDGFVEDFNSDPDLSVNVGGVPLGVRIAEDIYDSGMTKSTVPPRGR